MAQKVFTTYRAAVESLPLCELHVGFLKPGRYNGFRTLTALTGLSLEIGHDNPQTIKKNVGGYVPFGAIVTTNGSIIHESAAIPITLDNNLGNDNTRYDILVCEHEYVAIIGGQPATYLVIKGDLEGNTPTLPNPEKQVLVGTFSLGPGGFNIDTLSYSPVITPLLGDMTAAEAFELLEIPEATTIIKGITQYATDIEAEARILTDKALSPASIMAIEATTTKAGLIEIATLSEVEIGTDVERAVTPAGLKSRQGKRELVKLTIGTGAQEVPLPLSWDGKTVIISNPGGVSDSVTVVISGDVFPNSGNIKINNRTNNGKAIILQWDPSTAGAKTFFNITGRVPKILANGTVEIIFDNNDSIAYLTGDLATS